MQTDKVPAPIYMVDDNADDFEVISRAFRRCRLQTDLVYLESADALKIALEQGVRPGMILLDLNMPASNGHEILQWLKSNPDYCDIPVTILTSSHSRKDVAESYRLGANSYMQKPYSAQKLDEVVQAFEQFWLKTAILPNDQAV